MSLIGRGAVLCGCSASRCRPGGAAAGLAAQVFGDHADLVGGDVELVLLRVLEDQVVALGAGESAVRDPA